MLAEGQGRPIAPGGRISLLRGETPEPMDDLLVGTANERYGFIQAKRRVSFSDKPDSEFTSVIDQAVRQIVASTTASGSRPWSRELSPSTDRLLLVTSSLSGSNINVLLRDVLSRAMTLAPNQPLSDAAVTKGEGSVLKKTGAIVRSVWQSATGHAPTDDEVRSVLSLLSVEVLDVEEGELGEREAMRTLSSTVIEDAHQGGAAWASVLKACRKMVAGRSGLDLASLRRQLQDDGIALRAPGSYRKDIERLQTQTRNTLKSLADLSQIVLDGKPIHIDRAVIHPLQLATDRGSYLITGHPGAGKSGALYDLAEALQSKGDVVCLAADRLDIASLSALRSELGLERELTDVFANWFGSRPGYLLIDALDAARGTRAADALLELIRHIVKSNSRWRVVACIRKFDLRYSQDLQELFGRSAMAAADDQFLDSEFPFVQHINVPLLSEEELGQLKVQAPSLYDLYAGSPDSLRRLLHVPFNLRLAATLLQTGMLAADFAPIQTQIDLLNRYWERRVVGSSGGDDREAVLRHTLSGMVSKRRLQVDREVAAGLGLSSALDQLLSLHVLTEWQPSPTATPDRRALAFEHNFLFDFAVAKLYLPRVITDLVQMFENDADSVMLLRPSIALRAQELWASDRSQFWDLTFSFAESTKISLLAQMIPMATVAENARDIGDLEPLIQALGTPAVEQQRAGDRALRYLVGVLKAGRKENKPLAGADAGPWCELLERITPKLRPELVGISQALVEEILAVKHQLSVAQLAWVGMAARRILDAAWHSPRRNGQMIIHALRSVCATYISDPAESAIRIRRALTPERVRQYGYEELHWLAREVRNLISLDAELVADMYAATFEWTDKDETTTPMVGGQIVPMSSNRRQDYKQAQWQLAQCYPDFVKKSPIAAARAMIAIVSAYCRDKEIESQEFGRAVREHMTETVLDEAVEALLEEDPPEPPAKLHVFVVEGVEVALKEDDSFIWDGGVSSHDEAIQILNAFFQHLDVLADDEKAEDQTLQIIRLVMRGNQQAIVWRRLLALIAKHPRLASKLRRLSEAKPLMVAPETTKEFGLFIKTLYPLLSSEERGQLENRILELGDAAPGDELQIGQGQRDELLTSLGEFELVKEAARDRTAKLKEISMVSIPLTSPFSGFGQLSPEDAEELHHSGETPGESAARQQVKPFSKTVEEFGSRHMNGVPPLEESEAILPAMLKLVAFLEDREVPILSEKLKDSVLASLAGTCAEIARDSTLDCETGLGKTVKKVLLLAATNRHPEPRPDELKQFDKGPGGFGFWPISRIVATEGLMAMAAGHGCKDAAIVQALSVLLKDPAPSVRYPIARYVTGIRETHPAQMWEWVEALSEDESMSIREACVQALGKLATIDATRSLTLMVQILEGIPNDQEGADRLTCTTVQALTCWYVWRNSPIAKAAISGITSNILERARQAGNMLYVLREPLTHGSMDESGEPAEIRRRAVEVLKELSKESCEMVRSVLEKSKGKQQPTTEELAAAKSLLKLTNVIVGEMYFAAGAHQPGRESLPALITRPEQTRFYGEADGVFDDLASIGAPSLAHHLMETLEMYIDTDPGGVFLRMAATIRAGKRWEYEYEQLAQDVVLRVVRRYLADKRALLQNDNDCQRALREILETFIEAGWPAAQQLAYRIDEIHR
jgi:hypothetical protein